LTKEIFTLIAGLVVAFISATTIGFVTVFGHPANLFAVFFLIALALVSFAEDKDADATRLSTWLKRRDGPMLYTRTVQGLMRGLDRLLMPGTAADQPMPERGMIARWNWLSTPRARDQCDLQRLRANPWSWPVYDTALNLAVAYPIFLAMAQWTWNGAPTGLGPLTFLPEEPNGVLRTAIFYPIALAIVLRLVHAATLRRVYEISAMWLIILAGVIAVALGFAGAVAGAGAIALAGAVAGVGAVALAVSIAFAGAVAVEFTIVEFAVASSVAAAIVIAFAVAVAAFPIRFARQARGEKGYALFTVAMFVTLLSPPLTVGFPSDNPLWASIWLLLGLLPLLNAIFDWLSYGLTIWLIREGNRRKGLWTLGFWLVDAASAAFLFFALSLTLTCAIGWTNAALAAPILDLHALFTGLTDPDTRGAHFWVAGMIFSTLVPTVVHLIIVALSAITWVPPRLRTWCEAGIGLRHVSGQAFTLSALVVSALYAVYALLLTWGLFKLASAVMAGVSAAIPWYLRLVETCARAAGAM
jgi:hypothetical protein